MLIRIDNLAFIQRLFNPMMADRITARRNARRTNIPITLLSAWIDQSAEDLSRCLLEEWYDGIVCRRVNLRELTTALRHESSNLPLVIGNTANS
jgi:hypothetical protein